MDTLARPKLPAKKARRQAPLPLRPPAPAPERARARAGVELASPAVHAEAVRRPRGRPRKTVGELDEGNRRRMLIDAAAHLFRTQGFDATSTRDIAAAAGMHSGSPFYHFESKSALLYTIISDGMEQAALSQQQALAMLPARSPARAQLRALIRHHFEVLLGPHSDFIPVMLYEWRALDAAQRQRIALVKDAYEAEWMPVLKSLARSGALQAEPAVARLFIFGALNWAVQWYDARGGKTLDQLTEQALALFIRED